jgi:holo-ACP synthase
VLAARDARQRAMDASFGAGATIVAASLAIPGAEKVPPGAAALFESAVAALARTLPAPGRVHAALDALGPFELWATSGDAAAVKHVCVALEASVPAARLLDLDVHSSQGVPFDRASLHLPPRACVVCGEPARACIRARRHAPADAVASAHALLAAFRARRVGAAARRGAPARAAAHAEAGARRS